MRRHPRYGSSPLARGTRPSHGLRHPRGRFIPARAGNTWARASSAAVVPVHPRSRGEHSRSWLWKGVEDGSSPLARGTHGSIRSLRGRVRFIPARAGNTPAPCCPARPRTVHPRSRGEHFGIGWPKSLLNGSSPLARGTRRRRQAHPDGLRFIPARAGNTPTPRSRPCAGTVHPRSRGEHAGSSGMRACSTGSSPLARGTHLGAAQCALERRFIPARAGNTSSPRRRGPGATVHPRSRGEHDVAVILGLTVSGSSPLARGTQRRPDLRRAAQRFIPARAGNTPKAR